MRCSSRQNGRVIRVVLRVRRPVLHLEDVHVRQVPRAESALKRVFGDDSTIPHCAIRVGKNITQNAGQHLELPVRF